MKKRLPDQAKALIEMLRQAREAWGWTQSGLARRLGRVQSHISEVEAGVTDPRLSTLAFMAEALGQQLMLIPRERSQDVLRLLGHVSAPPQIAHTVPSVYEEVFVPDPPDEDEEDLRDGQRT